MAEDAFFKYLSEITKGYLRVDVKSIHIDWF